jgi:transcriptional regulator of acetoin/glycerol metabolism
MANTSYLFANQLSSEKIINDQRALEQTGGSMTEAARLLGIGRKTLYRKLHDKT